jgi:hypothetical protein
MNNIQDGEGGSGGSGGSEVGKKRKFWICRPHEGPEQYEFILESVVFSDGISRFIYKSEIVPEEYFPKMVYIFSAIVGGYEYVGEYVNKKGLIVRSEDNYVLIACHDFHY